MSWLARKIERAVDGWLGRNVEKLVEAEVEKFCASDRFVVIVHDILLESFAKAAGAAMPRDRNMFVWAIAADVHARWGYSKAEAMKLAPHLMDDLEEACAPWGDPGYDWSVGAAREWVTEQLQSDEVAQ